MFEEKLAWHCGPALAGIKPGNLVVFKKSEFTDINYRIDLLNEKFNKKDIYFNIVCQCEKRAMVFVYRKDKLTKHLEKPEIKNFLLAYGYSDFSDVNALLKRLSERLKTAEFPHEIGAFLGYPIEDIKGFISHRDKDCKLVGDWRVYSNPETAELTFKRYKTVRKTILERMSHGKSLAEIFCAA